MPAAEQRLGETSITFGPGMLHAGSEYCYRCCCYRCCVVEEVAIGVHHQGHIVPTVKSRTTAAVKRPPESHRADRQVAHHRRCEAATKVTACRPPSLAPPPP